MKDLDLKIKKWALKFLSDHELPNNEENQYIIRLAMTNAIKWYMIDELSDAQEKNKVLDRICKNSQEIVKMLDKSTLPKVGDEIYVPTSLYIDHGANDFIGGICTISHIQIDMYGVMVFIKERPGRSYPWDYLLKNQEKWKKEYKQKRGHKSPD